MIMAATTRTTRMLSRLLLFLLVASVSLSNGVAADNISDPASARLDDTEMDELDELIAYLNTTPRPANVRIGFLSDANVDSVARLLPVGRFEPVVVRTGGKEALVAAVLNGTLIAGLTSGIPDEQHHASLHIFSSTLVTIHALLMAPDYSEDVPHGAAPASGLTTFDLSMALNAALTRVQLAGLDVQLAAKNGAKRVVQAHTCKETAQSQFAVANRAEARGLLRKVLDTGRLRVLAMGPYDWGHDGNYTAAPPTGFYPDLLDAVVSAFGQLAGADGIAYGAVSVERVYANDPIFPWHWLFDGTAHLTEPYFILDASYTGSGKPCQSNDQCLAARLPLSGNRETCQNGRCVHPARARADMLRPSCTALGSDSSFFTKRTRAAGGGASGSNGSSAMQTGSIVAIVILAVATATLGGLVIFMIVKEKTGRPMFFP